MRLLRAISATVLATHAVAGNIDSPVDTTKTVVDDSENLDVPQTLELKFEPDKERPGLDPFLSWVEIYHPYLQGDRYMGVDCAYRDEWSRYIFDTNVGPKVFYLKPGSAYCDITKNSDDEDIFDGLEAYFQGQHRVITEDCVMERVGFGPGSRSATCGWKLYPDKESTNAPPEKEYLEDGTLVLPPSE